VGWESSTAVEEGEGVDVYPTTAGPAYIHVEHATRLGPTIRTEREVLHRSRCGQSMSSGAMRVNGGVLSYSLAHA